MRYVALLDGRDGAWGVTFPDAPGCHAMGDTVDAALQNAAEALEEWVTDRRGAGETEPIARTPDQLRADPDVAEAIAAGALLV